MNLQINNNVFTCNGNFISYVWTYYDNIIQGAFTNIYAAPQPGIYGVYATDNQGCTTYSGMIHYLNAGFDEYDSEYEITILRSDGNIIFEIFTKENLTEKSTLVLYDISGKIIQNIKVSHLNELKYTATVHSSQIPAGIILFKISGTEMKGKLTEIK